ncbi:hypothetical protein E2C01_013105 [Portunus trituberculatus]|uniref:Uncharacterized protein n=1 Tax=Portunus trituberculatus TaxID=210409 RepID=A0A5B7DG20_PORTR|nr:hypothetical protein [Portunus trituberculatus]
MLVYVLLRFGTFSSSDLLRLAKGVAICSETGAYIYRAVIGSGVTLLSMTGSKRWQASSTKAKSGGTTRSVVTASSGTTVQRQIHFSGLKRSLQKRLPREGDNVVFTVHGGDKGSEARDTRRTSMTSHPKPPLKTWDVEAKISACICAAKVLAGGNARRLQALIPLLLTHNGLPGIRIPPQAFGTLFPYTSKPPRGHQPSRQNKVQPRSEDLQEEVEIVEEDEEEEDELVDLEESDSDQPLPPVELPPAEEVGWETPKKKKKKTNSTSTTLPAEAEPTSQPSPQTTDHYLLRRKKQGTRREDTPPKKLTFSDVIQKGYGADNDPEPSPPTGPPWRTRHLVIHPTPDTNIDAAALPDKTMPPPRTSTAPPLLKTRSSSQHSTILRLGQAPVILLSY